MSADGTRACRANLLKNRKALSAIPGIKKAFVNFLIETLFAALKSFLHFGIRLINLDSAVLMTFGSHKQTYGRSV